MIMFINLKNKLTKIINRLNKDKITISDAKKKVWWLTKNRYNYPLRMDFEAHKDALKKITKPKLIAKLNQAIEYIDKNNAQEKIRMKKAYIKTHHNFKKSDV